MSRMPANDASMFDSVEHGQGAVRTNAHFCDRNRVEDEMIDRVDKTILSKRAEQLIICLIESRPDLMRGRA